MRIFKTLRYRFFPIFSSVGLESAVFPWKCLPHIRSMVWSAANNLSDSGVILVRKAGYHIFYGLFVRGIDL